MTALSFLQVGALTLHYSVTGQSHGSPLVFINSLGTDSRIWHGITPYLAPYFKLIYYDKRGHGLSDCPSPPYTLRDHSDDLAGLLSQLHLDKVVLIGDSVGGMIALDYASRHPGQINGLILCDTAAKIGDVDMWNERIDTLQKYGLPYLADAILSRWFSPDFKRQQPAAYEGYRNMLTRSPLAGYIGTCMAIRDADLGHAVPKLTIKTLIMCGAEDSATPPDMVRALAGDMPDAHFEVIPGAGHIPSIEQPEAMALLIHQFMNEHLSENQLVRQNH